jgi:hypothetical protein
MHWQLVRSIVEKGTISQAVCLMQALLQCRFGSGPIVELARIWVQLCRHRLDPLDATIAMSSIADVIECNSDQFVILDWLGESFISGDLTLIKPIVPLMIEKVATSPNYNAISRVDGLTLVVTSIWNILDDIYGCIPKSRPLRYQNIIFAAERANWPTDKMCAANDHRIDKLAQAIFETKSWGATPILADAIEEAGCDDCLILDHLRKPAAGTHWEGCWVLDHLLGFNNK